MSTLLLYASYTDLMSYYDDWVDAFKEHPAFDLTAINICAPQTDIAYLKKILERSELIILHHSMNGDTLKYLHPFVSALKNRKGKLVSFVGNEVNLPTIGMAPKIKILKDLDTDIIATQLLQEAGEWLYAECSKSKIISLPHALNPKAFYPSNSYQKRTIDIGTRSARYGVYIGDNDRNAIIDFFHQNAERYGLSVDLGLEDGKQKRFNRQKWHQFLNSCKATLSTEAGSFYLEKDDRIVSQIVKYLQDNQKTYILPHENPAIEFFSKVFPKPLKKVTRKLIQNFVTERHKADEKVDFAEIKNQFFREDNKCQIYSKAISSRHFDAVGTKTLHVMYSGRYNDILYPGEHFFELKRDHSNLGELIDLIKDNKKVQEITNNAYDYVLSYHTHEHRLNKLLDYLDLV